MSVPTLEEQIAALPPGYRRAVDYLLEESKGYSEFVLEEFQDRALVGWLAVKASGAGTKYYYICSPLGRVWGGAIYDMGGGYPEVAGKSPVEAGLPLLRDADYESKEAQEQMKLYMQVRSRDVWTW